jgi:alcohol dehydrogenase
VVENPSEQDVAECVAFCQENGFDGHDFFNGIVGLGGGSSLDTAKGANFILTNGGRMADYQGLNKASKPFLPMIAVPTTAGTGSEFQCYAVIADSTTHLKLACGDNKAYARVALLDPMLTVSQPNAVTACTGMDAISHAIESYVSTAHTELSQIFSLESWKLAEANFAIVLQEPNNLAARGAMLLASAYGGMAIDRSMLGAAHSAANPLTARYGIVHGQAVGLMLPHVIRFNSSSTTDGKIAQAYMELAQAVGLGSGTEILLKRLAELLHAAGLSDSLSALNVLAEDISVMASDAAKQWTARYNPREILEADFIKLYQTAMR